MGVQEEGAEREKPEEKTSNKPNLKAKAKSQG